MSKLWAIIAEKGKWATLLGMFLAFPTNIQFLSLLFSGYVFTVEELYPYIFANIMAMFWFILPSSIKLSSDKFTFEVKD